jgi:phospho-N-acetylmuramoyl-pentapeptide-transferase
VVYAFIVAAGFACFVSIFVFFRPALMAYALVVGGFTFFVAFAAGHPLLGVLRRFHVRKQVRSEGPDSHFSKTGTPTMGGILIWGSVLVSTALFNVPNNPSILVPLGATAGSGLVGTVDDILGLMGDSAEGLTVRMKFFGLAIIAHLQTQTPLMIFCFTVVGALLAFLWFNAYPADLFMGDAGSLSLGAALATVALMTGHLLLLPIIGAVFVAEALSVIFQVAFFKLTHGRRLLRMSPLHHHFELIGWSETHVAQRFWLASMLTGMVGIALALI